MVLSLGQSIPLEDLRVALGVAEDSLDRSTQFESFFSQAQPLTLAMIEKALATTTAVVTTLKEHSWSLCEVTSPQFPGKTFRFYTGTSLLQFRFSLSYSAEQSLKRINREPLLSFDSPSAKDNAEELRQLVSGALLLMFALHLGIEKKEVVTAIIPAAIARRISGLSERDGDSVRTVLRSELVEAAHNWANGLG